MIIPSRLLPHLQIHFSLLPVLFSLSVNLKNPTKLTASNPLGVAPVSQTVNTTDLLCVKLLKVFVSIEFWNKFPQKKFFIEQFIRWLQTALPQAAIETREMAKKFFTIVVKATIFCHHLQWQENPLVVNLASNWYGRLSGLPSLSISIVKCTAEHSTLFSMYLRIETVSWPWWWCVLTVENFFT